jgi:hypothetical protein
MISTMIDDHPSYSPISVLFYTLKFRHSTNSTMKILVLQYVVSLLQFYDVYNPTKANPLLECVIQQI